MKAGIALAVLMVLMGGSSVAGKDNPGAACGQVQKSFEAWNAHDADRVTTFYTSDIVYEDVAFGMTSHGTAEMRKMVTGFFTAVPDLRLEVVSCSSEGNHGSVEWTFSGTDVGLYKTGKKFSVHGASRFETRGIIFSSNKDFYDSATIMRQVGALPAQGQ